MASSSAILKSLPANETPAKVPSLTEIEVCDLDFMGEQYNWLRPDRKYNQVATLPIYIGEGCTPPFSSVSFPVSRYTRRQVGDYALRFIDGILKPVKAENVVAITRGRNDYWEYGIYFGAYGWDKPDIYSFFQKFEDRKDLKWLSFVDDDGKIVTLISKTKDDLFHLQVFKESELYYQAHVLNLVTGDGKPVELHKMTNDNAQILHDMLSEALKTKKVIYNHCAAGIGRSGEMMLAELIMLQQSPEFKALVPEGMPELKDQQYPMELLAWAHKNIRRGLLGYPYKREVNISQVEDCLLAANHLLDVHKHPEKSKAPAERVLLTEADTRPVLTMTQGLEEHKKAKEELLLETARNGKKRQA